jgi:hypothetical protein
VRLFRRATPGGGVLDAYVGRFTVAGDGGWTAGYRALPAGQLLTATQSVPWLGTSELSGDTAYADVTPPETRITAGPSGRTSEHEPAFQFAATEAGSTFSCSLDFAAYAPCASPLRLHELVGGWHTFQVRAADAAGNADPSPASRRFSVPKAGSVDRLAPRIFGFWMLKRNVRPLRPGRKPARGRGSEFRYTLSEPARVSIVIERSLRRRHGRRQLRRVLVIRRRAGRGPNGVRFSGRAGRRALPSGSYRATIHARDAAGNRARARRLGFAVVR